MDKPVYRNPELLLIKRREAAQTELEFISDVPESNRHFTCNFVSREQRYMKFLSGVCAVTLARSIKKDVDYVSTTVCVCVFDKHPNWTAQFQSRRKSYSHSIF